MKIKIKKLHPDAKIPAYAKDGDAAVDLTAVDKIHDPSNGVIEYRTGLAVEIPEGHVGLIFPRSSIYKTCHLLSNSVGLIDSGYRGEIKFMFRYASRKPEEYNIGDRVGQLMVIPYPKVEFEVVEELSDSSRGTGGFGSTNEEKTNVTP